MVPYKKTKLEQSIDMNTLTTSVIVVLIVLALIFIFGKEFFLRSRTKRSNMKQYMEELRVRCKQEQDRLAWILAGDRSVADKAPDIRALITRDVNKLNQEELYYLMQRINATIHKLGAGEIKHPDAQSRAEVLGGNITRLKEGNIKTSRVGRAATQAAKQRRTVTLPKDLQKKF